MKKICYVATIPAAVHAFLRSHIQAAAAKYEITVICNGMDSHLLAGLKARIILMPIERRVSPARDLLVLWRLFWLFKRERFDLVHAHMPKTGLLGMLAARLAGIRTRVNTCHGEVWVTRRGWRRAVLKGFDRLVGVLATDILAVGHGQRDFLAAEGVAPPAKIRVIGAGSICGVDSRRFKPDSEARRLIREELGVRPEARVILFVGRLNRDKGMLDLAAAFAGIAPHYPDLAMLLVGAEEEVGFASLRELCQPWDQCLHYRPFTTVPERWMAAADIYCLPSYREGFNMTVIEAAACGVPAVASRIYGIADGVVDGETGLLFPVGDVIAMAAALGRLLDDHNLRRRMGEAARERAGRLFSAEEISRGMLTFYEHLLDERRR